MSEEDKLFNFLADLQGWAQAELHRREVRDIPSAFVVAEALVDFRCGTTLGSGGQGKGKRKSASPPRGRADKKDGVQPHAAVKPKGQATFAGYFICGGPHLAHECSRKVAVAAVTTHGDKAFKSSEEEPVARMAPLQSINTLTARRQRQGLMYVRVRVNGRTVRALVDSGAMHNFVSQGAAHRLGLGALSKPCRVKPVNSEEMESLGQVEATLEVGSWTGRCSMTVLPIDDYDLILGMDFFIKSKAMVMPYRRGILIQKGRRPYFVPVEGWRRIVKGRGKGVLHHQT